MKVTACSNVGYGAGIRQTIIPKPKNVTPKTITKPNEPDYGKGLKQLSYIIGISMLGISTIALGTRGKFCSLKF